MRNNDLLNIYSWLTSNQEALNLKIYKRDWSLPFKDILPKHYCCSYITIGDKSHFGLSVQSDIMAAQTISAVEAYERAFMHSQGIKNSNGCAVHTDQDTCIKNSQNELMERDAYLRLHFLGNSFKEIQPPKDGLINTCKKELNALGIKLHFGHIGHNDYGSACIAIADGRLRKENPFGIMIGLGFEEELDQSLEKSFFEILRFIDGSFSENHPLDAMSFNDFASKEKAGVHEHIALGMDLEYADFLIPHYLEPNELKNHIPTTPKFENFTRRANIEGLPECPLYFSQAKSKDLIDIEFGNNPNHDFLAGKLSTDDILHFQEQIAFHILG